MERLPFNRLVARLRMLKGRTLVAGHSQADVDAVASAFVLAGRLPNAQARLLDRPRSSAHRVLGALGFPPAALQPEELTGFQNLVLVDTSNAGMLGAFTNELHRFAGHVIAIDHHRHGREMDLPLYVDEAKTSCSEIVLEIARKLGPPLSKKESALLACGLLEDSALLKGANNQTVDALNDLLHVSGRDLQELVSLLVSEPDIGMRQASLQAFQNIKIRRAGDLLMAACDAPAYESRVASVLVQSGADLALVTNAAGGKIALLKSRHPALKKLQAGRMAQAVAKTFGGSGGGHEFAAGLRVPPAKTAPAVARLQELCKNAISRT